MSPQKRIRRNSYYMLGHPVSSFVAKMNFKSEVSYLSLLKATLLHIFYVSFSFLEFSTSKGNSCFVLSASFSLHMDHSEKWQGSSTNVVPAEESMGKNTVSEGRNEDVMTSSSQGRPLCSKHEAPSGRVCKEYTKESLSLLRKRCASQVVGKEVVGRRIKIWWPLDKRFYSGKILYFDDEYKVHQIDYDDGDMELLDLTTECWKLLKDGNSSAHKQEIGTAPGSSSGAK